MANNTMIIFPGILSNEQIARLRENLKELWARPTDGIAVMCLVPENEVVVIDPEQLAVTNNNEDIQK